MGIYGEAEEQDYMVDVFSMFVVGGSWCNRDIDVAVQVCV